MTEEKSGFVLRYRSARALRRDHEISISKGGMLVPWKSAPPPPLSMITVRIESPDGTMFDMRAKVGAKIAGRGFAVGFEVDPVTKGRTAIDLFMRGDRMKRLVDAEKTGSVPAEPEVSPLGSMSETIAAIIPEEETDPGANDVLSSDTESSSFDGATDADDAGEIAEEESLPEAPEEDVEQALPEGFRKPEPGEEYLVYVLKFAQVREYAAIRDKFRSTQRIDVHYTEEKQRAGKIAELRLTLPGHNLFNLWGVVEKVGPTAVTLAFDENNEKFRLACNYVDTPSAKSRIKNEADMPASPPSVVRLIDKVPEEDPEKMPIRRRLQRMGMDDKINMALSGGREERMALAMDGNKAIHHYLLRNAKISLDEIAFMARLPTMNPDVLDKIAENVGYTQNPSVVKALVYNPKTPVLTAIRLLDRLPRPEVMNLAKRMNMNLRLVMAAKKKLEGRRK